MKVLLAGANGQLGTALQDTRPQTYTILPITRADVDLTQTDALRKKIEEVSPDILINAAAYTAVDRAESEPELAQAINVDAVQAMSQAMENCGGRLVQVSTDFVFDGMASKAYLPGDERAPLSAYGKSKAQGEDMLRPEDLLVRTAWVYAAGHGNFVATMLRLMRERDELKVVSDQIGSPTWATGLAQTLWGLIDVQASGAYHHSDAGVASWYDFAVAIAEEALAIGLLEKMPKIIPITTEEYPTPAVRPRFSLLDCRATRAAIGAEATHWRHNLRLMLAEEAKL